MLSPMLESGRIELLAVPATLDEFLLDPTKLLIEQEVRLMDQTDNGIGPNFRIRVFKPVFVELPSLLIREIGYPGTRGCDLTDQMRLV